jgi:hypothetical protein
VPKIEKVGSLQVEQDLAFQRLEWRFERIGKALIALFLLAAIAGVFGRGYLSRAQKSSPSGSLTVQHERFARRDAPTELEIDATGAPNAEIRIWLSRPAVQGLRIEQVTPEQVETQTSPERTTYVFRTDGSGHAHVRFDVEPRGPGKMVSQVGIDGGEQLAFWTFVYP